MSIGSPEITTNAEAGPSEPRTQITIPSTGLEYWKYRRACFLAGVPFPSCSASEPLPDHYTVPEAPQPLTCQPYRPREGSSVARLESLLADFGAEESNVSWNGGVATVHRKLVSGTAPNKPLRLGLVIKVLRAGWLRDGTWPMDPATRKPVAVPDSPTAGSRALAALDAVPPNVPALQTLSPKSAQKPKGKLISRRNRGFARVEEFRRKELACRPEQEDIRQVEEDFRRDEEKADERRRLEASTSPSSVKVEGMKECELESPRKSKLLPNPILNWRWKKKT